MASLFISYSRKYIETARKLTEAFKRRELDILIDRRGCKLKEPPEWEALLGFPRRCWYLWADAFCLSNQFQRAGDIVVVPVRVHACVRIRLCGNASANPGTARVIWPKRYNLHHCCDGYALADRQRAGHTQKVKSAKLVGDGGVYEDTTCLIRTKVGDSKRCFEDLASFCIPGS
jgi:hypothetical protein